jgi:hypothetical protein
MLRKAADTRNSHPSDCLRTRIPTLGLMAETLADAAAELARLREVLDEGQDGASDEWIAAVVRAIRHAEARVRRLQGADDRPDQSASGEVGDLARLAKGPYFPLSS